MDHVTIEHSELEHVKYPKGVPILCRVVSFEGSSPHWHYEYETLFVLRGAVTVTSESGVFHLDKGAVFLLNSREIHAVSTLDKNNLCFLLQWSPAALLEVYESRFSFSLNTRGEDPPAPAAVRSFQAIFAEMGLAALEKPDGYQFTLKGGLYRFIGLLFGAARYTISKPDTSGATETRLEDFDAINRFLKEHFREKLSVDRICAEVAMSRAKMFKTLKIAGARSAMGMVNYYRVEHAKNLLASSRLSIPYIACESGFDSDSSFYRVFKEMTGIPPNQYRVSPGEKPTPPGIQGYAVFSPMEAVRLLREYAE